MDRTQLLKGTLDAAVLATISREDAYGYDVVRRLRAAGLTDIGDAVNVSARVEAATRDTGDDLLITAATRDALTRALPLASRGTVPLKGKAEPVEVCACLAVEPDLVGGQLHQR